MNSLVVVAAIGGPCPGGRIPAGFQPPALEKFSNFFVEFLGIVTLNYDVVCKQLTRTHANSLKRRKDVHLFSILKKKIICFCLFVCLFVSFVIFFVVLIISVLIAS